MKYNIIILLILPVFVVSCTGNFFDNGSDNYSFGSELEKNQSSLVNDFSSKGISIPDQPFPACDAVKNRMVEVIEAYIKLETALAHDELEETNKAAALMAKKVKVVPLHRLNGDGRLAWQNQKDLYEAKLKEMQQIEDIESKRSYFSQLSGIIYFTIKSFNLKNDKLYVTFCPMAFDGKGAYWISAEKKFRNPYFGSRMPDCGEIKEVI